MPPKKAVEILKRLVSDAGLLPGEPFGSPRREQWESTARGVLERSFGADSSIINSFKAARSIVFNAKDSDQELRQAANKTLSSIVAVLHSAVEQLGWEVEQEEAMTSTKDLSATSLQLGDHGIAFLPDGCSLPSGSYPVYCRLEVSKDGAAAGDVHFHGEPKHPRPIVLGKEFDLHVPHPDSILGDSVILNVRFVDDSGSVAGYVHGSSAQFHPNRGKESRKSKDTSMNSRDVFVIHGRDERLRSGMFEFLRSLGLSPMEWTHAVELTGKGAPYVGEVLDAAFSNAQAVVVLFTPDDLVRLRPELCSPKEPEHETSLTPQARPNVLFESGMAMARNPDRTIFVEIGGLRPFSDVGGRHMVRMDQFVQEAQRTRHEAQDRRVSYQPDRH